MAEAKPEIKVDAADSPSKLADIDEFEEDTDLQIPPKDTRGGWLIKVSEDLWKAWNDMYQNSNGDEVEVGKLRVYHKKDGEKDERVQIRLSEDRNAHKLLPSVYNLDIKASDYNNTVVFSEKDLPGHRMQQLGANRNLAASKPTGIPSKADRFGQKKGGYRTAIPKQTALAPQIVNEAVAKPVEDDSLADYFKRNYDNAMNAGKKTIFMNKIDRGVRRPGENNFTFGSMTSKPGKGNKKKEPKEKAVRMSRDNLIDELSKCFSEYQYWPLRALRAKLNQPEAWLKEVLDELGAYPMRSGDFAGNYRLNETSARLLQIDNTKMEMAPVKDESDQGTGDELGEKDDEDMEDFEDVKMED